MRDEQSKSLWDHITGECFDGSLKGERLQFWHVALTTVEAELARNSNAVLLKSGHHSLKKNLLKWVHSTRLGDKSFINREKTKLGFYFRSSMSGDIDARLPEGDQGLGVIDAQDKGKFYPLRLFPKGEVVTDVWQGRTLLIECDSLDGVPSARWADGGEAPMQLLSRWYGFSFTYPDCEIYEGQ